MIRNERQPSTKLHRQSIQSIKKENRIARPTQNNRYLTLLLYQSFSNLLLGGEPPKFFSLFQTKCEVTPTPCETESQQELEKSK